MASRPACETSLLALSLLAAALLARSPAGADDCFADGHHGRFGELARGRGLAIHPESGGPFYPRIDALQCLSRSDVPVTLRR